MPVESQIDVNEFDCGNSSINCLVSKSVFSTVLNQTKTYKVTIKSNRVGFFAISILGISLEDSDAQIAAYYEGTPSYGAVKVDFIAVERCVQKRGIGTVVLEYLVKDARTLSEHWPVRLLFLDALRNKVDWYIGKGFAPLNSADLSGDSPTVRLYIDLMSAEEKEKLDYYIQNSIDY